MARSHSSTLVGIVRKALLLLGLLAPLNVPYSVPSLSVRKAFGWSSRSLDSDGQGRQVVTRTLRRARAAGLLAGDVLLTIDGATASAATLAVARERSVPGDTLNLVVQRGTEQRLIPVVVGQGSASYSGFLVYMILLSLIAWVTGMAVLVWYGKNARALVLGAALLLMPPSFFPSGMAAGALAAAIVRAPWQLMSVSYTLLFPALLLHFTALHGVGPRLLRRRATWVGIYAGLAGVLASTTASATLWSEAGPGRGARTLVAATLCALLLTATVALLRRRSGPPRSVRWIALSIALVACTTGIQVVFATWAPSLAFTEVISEVDSLALLLLPTLIAFHFFAPFGADGVWNSPRWVNTAGSLVVTGLYAFAVIGTAAVVLHLTAQELGGVEWLLFGSIFMVTIAFSPVIKHVRDLVDRRLLADWIARESRAHAFVERVAGELELDRIMARVRQELPPLLAVRSVELVLAEGWTPESAAPATLPSGAPERAMVTPRHGQARHTPSAVGVASVADAAETALLIPVRTADGTMAGALRIGKRLDGRPINEAGDGIHRIVTHGVAAALNNARIYVALRRAQDELARSEHIASLGALAGGLAHEIRNPLASLQMGLLLLEQDGADQHWVRRIRGDARRIDDLVAGLLRYTNRGAIEPEGPVDAREIASGCVADVRPLADDRAACISEHYPDGPACVLTTGAQLRLVISNLLANAVDSIDYGGSIDVDVALTCDTTVVSISDTGVGIDPELRERIFELNYSTKPNGTGIGLALARRETERMGGTIVADARSGGGTTLRVTLPRATVLPCASESRT